MGNEQKNDLRHAQKMEALGQLAAGLAHDFNNLLTVVQGNASLLLAAKSAASPDCRPLQNICAASDQAAKLLGELLTFCRRQSAHPLPTDLRDILAKAVAAMLPRISNPLLKVSAHAPSGLPLVSADAAMLETMLVNLAANARDAMPEGGQLSIRAAPVTLGPAEVSSNPEARAGEFVRLSVSDTGGGIPPEILPRIFEPFFSTKPRTKGAGLGLAAVYGIVQQHQGWIEVHSQVNQGTTFHVFLPVLAAGSPSQAPPAPPQAKPALNRETILVVDDEPDLRELVTQVLQAEGYEIISAGSGAEALEQWAKRHGNVHLLLTDIVLPDGLTGRKLAERLRGEDARLRVLYTSGYSAGVPGTELANVEDRNFLPKPYCPATLLRIVRECLDHPCSSVKHTRQAA